MRDVFAHAVRFGNSRFSYRHALYPRVKWVRNYQSRTDDAVLGRAITDDYATIRDDYSALRSLPIHGARRTTMLNIF